MIFLLDELGKLRGLRRIFVAHWIFIAEEHILIWHLEIHVMKIFNGFGYALVDHSLRLVRRRFFIRRMVDRCQIAIHDTPDAALVVKPYREPCIVQLFCKQHIGNTQKLIFAHWIGNRRSVPCGIVVVDCRHFRQCHDAVEIGRRIHAPECELFAFGKSVLIDDFRLLRVIAVDPLAFRPDNSVKWFFHGNFQHARSSGRSDMSFRRLPVTIMSRSSIRSSRPSFPYSRTDSISS